MQTGRLRFRKFVAGVCLFLSACGGGGDGGGTVTPVSAPPPPPTTSTPPPPPPPTNSAPTVSAVEQVSVQGGGVALLTASAEDPDGDALTYRWSQSSGPTVSISGDSSLSATFDAPAVPGVTVLEFEFTATDSAGLSASGATEVTVTTGYSPCTPVSPPATLGLDPFYEKYCDANGIPVLSSSEVPDEAIQWVRFQALEMLKIRPLVAAEMVDRGTRIAIMADTEVTTDIPEHRDLNTAFPGIDWDARARGLGATPARPASSAAEENILCYPGDVYVGENIFIHEFAHSIEKMGLQFVDSTFVSRLQATYDAAMASGLWVDTYAATNRDEYWAEGVQSWFDANLERDPPDGIHNAVNTRAELASYDPGLYQLILEVLPEESIALCPPP